MNLNSDQLEELNKHLKEEELGFPEFRTEVSRTGANYQWVKKALERSGKGSATLRALLGL